MQSQSSTEDARQKTILLPKPRGFCAGSPAYLVSKAGEIQPEWLDGCRQVGVTAGASTPNILVDQVIEYLKTLGFTSLREVELINEGVQFPLPPPLNGLEWNQLRIRL
jgi:4-hydroxy-3-methylbut-2-enyl diphosphate reductase IspH